MSDTVQMNHAISFIFLLFSTLVIVQTTFINDLEIENSFSESPPEIPFRYYANGKIFVPNSEIEEPFTAWYDAENGASRIDYFQGMVKTFKLEKEGQYGTKIKIFPITNENFTNKITCWKWAGTANNKVSLQGVVPVSLNGFNISNRKKSVIKYERKKIFTATGLTRDHFWFEYDTFLEKERISSSIFNTNAEVKCTMPYTYEIDQLYTFNPMREYIDGHDDIIDNAFENFKIIHSKKYNNAEHHYRKTIFQNNLRFIHFKNRANLGYTLKVNFLADRTPEELNILRGYRNSSSNHGSTPKPSLSPRNIQKKDGNPPESFDWRKYGAVSPVKDQGMSCQSCWSFAAVGAVEGAFFIHSNKAIEPLSEQALVDCSWGFQNYGCYCGRPEHAFEWIIKHGGIPTEKIYGPYIGLNGYCHIKNLPLTANIADWRSLANEGERAIKATLIKFGPIAVAINANPHSFNFYSHGVYYDKECEPQIQTHAVLLVGYGITTSGEKYWILKNSYSQNWGNDGYMSIAIKDNNCGVMDTPTYVTFKLFE